MIGPASMISCALNITDYNTGALSSLTIKHDLKKTKVFTKTKLILIHRMLGITKIASFTTQLGKFHAKSHAKPLHYLKRILVLAGTNTRWR